MLNDQQLKSTVHGPRGIVSINNIRVKWFSWEVESNNFYSADTFNVALPLSEQKEEMSLEWWARQTYLPMGIYAGFPKNADSYSEEDLELLILGEADTIEIDPVAGVVRLSGRDYTARLIDTKTTVALKNKRASEIASDLARSHGLATAVTETKDKVGTYYKIDHAKMTNQQSEWDLLTYLAQQEKYQVYVRGNKLHFEPLTKPSEENVYLLRWDHVAKSIPRFSGMDLKFSRKLTLAKDIIVKAQSWNQGNKKRFTKTAKSTHRQSDREPQTYPCVFPNLTPKDTLQKARNKLEEITRHEITLTTTLPGDNVLNPQCILRVQGTGLYDQDYYPDSVRRRMSVQDGYTMDVSAKNRSSESEIDK